MPVSQELIALSNELVRAVHDHDCEMGRDAFLDAASGSYEIDDWAYEEIDPEIYGDTAVIVSRYRQTARLDGRDLSHRMHVTDVWIRRNAHWQIVRRHATIAD